MGDQTFAALVTAQARAVARIEMKRRKFRKHLEQLDQEYREAQRNLKLLVASVEPYSPPDPALAREGNDSADGAV